MKKVESIETKMKFKVLGKCSIKSKTKREAKMKQNVELKTEEEKARDLLIRQTNRVDYELKKRRTRFWSCEQIVPYRKVH